MIQDKTPMRIKIVLSLVAFLLLATTAQASVPGTVPGTDRSSISLRNKNSLAYRLWLREQKIRELEEKFAKAISLAKEGKCVESRTSFSSGLEMIQKDNSLPTGSVSAATSAVSNCIQAERNVVGVTQTADLAAMAIEAAQMGQCGTAQDYLTQAQTLMTTLDGSGKVAEKTIPVLRAIKTVNKYCHRSTTNAK